MSVRERAICSFTFNASKEWLAAQAAVRTATMPPGATMPPPPPANEEGDGGGIFGDMFENCGEYESSLCDVDRVVAAVSVADSSSQKRLGSSARLRVSDYGAESFWHGRWEGEHEQAYEWFSVTAAAMWPALQPVANELGLLRPLRL